MSRVLSLGTVHKIKFSSLTNASILMDTATTATARFVSQGRSLLLSHPILSFCVEHRSPIPALLGRSRQGEIDHASIIRPRSSNTRRCDTAGVAAGRAEELAAGACGATGACGAANVTNNVLLRISDLNMSGKRSTKFLILRLLFSLASNTAILNAAAPRTLWSRARARMAVTGRPVSSTRASPSANGCNMRICFFCGLCRSPLADAHWSNVSSCFTDKLHESGQK